MNSYCLDGFDTASALAFEADLLHNPTAESWCFWEGPEAVVIGKNQNLWREVNAAAVFALELPVHRRISGGGTVFHGPGNLNFCHVFPSSQPLDFDRLLDPLILALAGLGIPVERRNCSDLWLRGGAKVSGNAVARRRGWWMHHGTLLVNADLARSTGWLGNSLGPDLSTRAVPSRPSPVGNLCDHDPGLSVRSLIDSLSMRLTGVLPMTPRQTPPPQSIDPAWIIGNTLPYSFAPGGGPGSGRIAVSGGRITASDHEFSALYVGRWHDPADLLEATRIAGHPPEAMWKTFFPSAVPDSSPA